MIQLKNWNEATTQLYKVGAKTVPVLENTRKKSECSQPFIVSEHFVKFWSQNLYSRLKILPFIIFPLEHIRAVLCSRGKIRISPAQEQTISPGALWVCSSFLPSRSLHHVTLFHYSISFIFNIPLRQQFSTCELWPLWGSYTDIMHIRYFDS